MGRTRHTSHIRSGPSRAVVGSLLALGLLAGCAGDDDDASSDAATETVATVAGRAGEGALSVSDDAPPADAAPRATPPAQGGFELGAIGRDVIVELRVQMETDDIARTVAAITADAVNAGGGVASSDISYGTADPDGAAAGGGHAVLVIKVPPTEVARVLGNLDGTGRVLSVQQSAQDVTDQLIDLDVRIANKRESVENVRKMMGQTTDLGQLVTLENELTWRQTELEQLEAQQRNLGDRVALSTLTIEIRPSAAPGAATPADDESLGDAFRDGWRVFGQVLFGIAFVAAALAPLIVTAAIVTLCAWVLMRLRRRPRPTPSEPLGTGDRPEQPDEPVDNELTPV